VAYAETFAMFLMLFLQSLDTPNIMQRFLEFITIYYPASKVKKIADLLQEEGSIDQNFC
jgi:hypothetical protein